MCTCIHVPTGIRLFGRNLDLSCSYGEEIVFCPRNAYLPFRHMPPLTQHYALLGAARAENGFPLYFDAVNEEGLAMAGLNFPYFCFYPPAQDGKDCLASFELIPYILGTCATVEQARGLLARITLVDTPFSPALPPTPLHFMLADASDCIVIESTKAGPLVHDNPIHVMTNSPPFPYHLQHLSQYMNVTAAPAQNRFSPALELRATGFGMGGLGLPGDLSSASRFVRAAFARANAPKDTERPTAIAHFFHMLDFVAFPQGCVILEDGHCEYTVYSSCIDLEHGIYYYKTQENSALTAVRMPKEQLSADHLICFGMPKTMQVTFLNQ